MRLARQVVCLGLAMAIGACAGGTDGQDTASAAGSGGSAGAGGSGGAAPACDDTVKNGAETDVDCGGETCPTCGEGRQCAGGSDCASQVCASGVCQAAACDDAVKNGAETDVDCGGSCPPCEVCGLCKIDGDCAPGLCTAGLCAPTIEVVSAVYAANCGAPTPVPKIAQACNKKQSCTYLFNYTVDVGYDPAYGCYKDLKIEYTCTGSMTTKTFYESCAPCDPNNTPTMITLDLFCAACEGPGEPPK